MAKHKAKTVGKNEDGTDISMYFPTFAHLVKCIVPAEGQTVKEMLLDELLAEYADEINGNTEALGKKVPLIHNAGGVRTLRDVVSKTIHATGVLKITLPVSWKDTTYKIEVSGANPGISSTFDLILGGSANPTTKWHYPSAMLISPKKFLDKVRFAHDGTNMCILLGASDTRWNYSQLSVEKVLDGSNTPHSGWSADIITDESGITNIVETPVSWVATDDGVWYDIPVINGATIQYNPPRYRKIGNIVYLRGEIRLDTTITQVTSQLLPVGFRPIQATVFSLLHASTFRTIMIDSGGNFTIHGGIDEGYILNLNLISYIADL